MIFTWSKNFITITVDSTGPRNSSVSGFNTVQGCFQLLLKPRVSWARRQRNGMNERVCSLAADNCETKKRRKEQGLNLKWGRTIPTTPPTPVHPHLCGWALIGKWSDIVTSPIWRDMITSLVGTPRCSSLVLARRTSVGGKSYFRHVLETSTKTHRFPFTLMSGYFHL